MTLGQASERGRLFRETFYVCRNCGREGETIEKAFREDWDPFTCSVGGAMKWGWGSAAVIVPFLVWMRWWESVFVIGGTLVASPVICWWENRKIAKARADRGLPRNDAPGSFPVAAPTAGCTAETVVGRALPSESKMVFRATGPCCDRPDWIQAFAVKDEDRVPCAVCRQGVMVVSEQSVH